MLLPASEPCRLPACYYYYYFNFIHPLTQSHRLRNRKTVDQSCGKGPKNETTFPIYTATDSLRNTILLLLLLLLLLLSLRVQSFTLQLAYFCNGNCSVTSDLFLFTFGVLHERTVNSTIRYNNFYKVDY